jgi:hypothetical protein
MPTSSQLNEILARYTGAARLSTGANAAAGLAPLEEKDASAIRAAGFPAAVPLTSWTRVDAARYTLLRELSAALPPAEFAAAALACFEQGDASEQTSWCRAVSLLPQPEQYLRHVIDACRTNILPLFESIACENPDPAAFFPERNFNQLVLKAMFNGTALARIVGLDRRRNPELARMATDYAAERTAANRPVPADIALAQ